ncbi:tyrosine-type recombinase/integrase [Ferroacidibacillus organovorans]|uniref:Tyr recombinase domain-containing protein n=1 Tax=Ferroacidibacillus organovorans TaxID=1765683 RepID=A0A853KAQ6_9BACL|nr:tyrosine-type recombinase/integrase [Ferroacidibacillus organovorans]KYP81659.1 hypothetical protein AYJ22_06430 [Ferroacidibacillus organovorans]OAG94142.1 hypothetical protein AYW79_06890 [Ferroacidibacillus organovorans]
MPRRRQNIVSFGTALDQDETPKKTVWSLAEAKTLFLEDIRNLAMHTQRWHRENLNALEKVLEKQGIVVQDMRELTMPLLKNNFVFYMRDTMHLKTNTINGRVRTVRALLHFVYEQGYVARDPGADVPLLRPERVMIQTFSEEQITHLLRQPDRHTFTGLRDYTMMLLLLETGIRLSECEGITLSDVNLQEGTILVHGKGSKDRTVPFQSKMKKVLQTYIEARGAAQTDRLFVTLERKTMSRRYIQELISQYGEAAQIRGVRVSPHTFRHTMAKFYVLAGGDIFSLQRILGHSSLETVRIYVEMFSHEVQHQHQKFSFVEHRFR